ncbi:MAG: HAMP domain-containing histidine kinase [Vallitaleaceae bacterium]|nr:HAMP domain-containing histidine kinase [Vallitaleaceae bacterium]
MKVLSLVSFYFGILFFMILILFGIGNFRLIKSNYSEAAHQNIISIMEEGTKAYDSDNDYYQSILNNDKIYYEIREGDKVIEYSNRYLYPLDYTNKDFYTDRTVLKDGKELIIVSDLSHIYKFEKGLIYRLVYRLAFVFVVGLLFTILLSDSISKPIHILEKGILNGEKVVCDNLESDMARLYLKYNELIESVDSNEKLKKEFISMISHELRTPLTSIKGWIEIVGKKNVDDRTLDQGILIINSEMERLELLISDLIDFNKYNKNSMKMTMDNNDLKIFLIEMAKTYQEYDIRVSYSQRAYNLKFDIDRMKQVFHNLIQNSIKFRGDSHVKIEIDLSIEKEFYMIKYRDYGTEMTIEEVNHMFDKFYKRNKVMPGVGLGLYVVKEIIQAHKGRVRAIHVDKGISLVILLPINI